MSGRRPSPDGRPVDLETVRADEELLSALAQGASVPEDDELATMLGAWRADLDTEPLPAFDLDLFTSSAAGTGTVNGAAGPAWAAEATIAAPAAEPTFAIRAAETTIAATAAEPAFPARAAGPAIAAHGEGDGAEDTHRLAPAAGGLYASARRPGRSSLRPRTMRLAVAAALVIATAGGVSVAAAGAGVDSPLWPVTRIVNPQVANLRAAQDAVAKARAAADAGHYDDARVLIDKAAALVAKVQDPQQAAQLRAELDAIRRALPAATPTGTAPPGRTPSGGGTAAPPAPTPAPGTGGPASGPVVGSPVPETPTPTGKGGLLPPLLPSLPPILPSLPHL